MLDWLAYARVGPALPLGLAQPCPAQLARVTIARSRLGWPIQALPSAKLVHSLALLAKASHDQFE